MQLQSCVMKPAFKSFYLLGFFSSSIFYMYIWFVRFCILACTVVEHKNLRRLLVWANNLSGALPPHNLCHTYVLIHAAHVHFHHISLNSSTFQIFQYGMGVPPFQPHFCQKLKIVSLTFTESRLSEPSNVWQHYKIICCNWHMISLESAA